MFIFWTVGKLLGQILSIPSPFFSAFEIFAEAFLIVIDPDLTIEMTFSRLTIKAICTIKDECATKKCTI